MITQTDIFNDQISDIIGSSEDIIDKREEKNASEHVSGEPVAIVHQVGSVMESNTPLETTPEDVLSAGSQMTKNEMFLPEIRVRY